MNCFFNREECIRFVKFGIVGISNTAISYIFYVIILLLLQWLGLLPYEDYLIAQIVGYVLSIFWAFFWNYRYVFEQSDNKWYVELWKSFIAYSFTGLILSTVLLYLWVDVFHISKLIAPIINLIITVPLNFIINKCWAFK